MTSTIMHSFVYKAPVQRVYDSLTIQAHLRQWWTPDALVGSKVGDQARFDFKAHGDFCLMEILRLKPNQSVVWKCIGGSMMQTPEWIGTIITFTLRALNANETALAFRHEKWNQMSKCFTVCRDGWHYFLGDSLKSYLETGMGKPYLPNTAEM